MKAVIPKYHPKLKLSSNGVGNAGSKFLNIPMIIKIAHMPTPILVNVRLNLSGNISFSLSMIPYCQIKANKNEIEPNSRNPMFKTLNMKSAVSGITKTINNS